MITLGSIAVITAIGLDTIIREPPAFAHPVVLFGRIINLIDQSYANPTVVGILITATFPVGFAATTAAIVSVALSVNSRLGAVTAGCVLFTLVSLRLLLTTVHDVVIMSTVDLSAARHDLRALAGRDASELDAAHIRSAAVESAAENLADGFIGPLLAFTMCAPVSISGGVAGAAWVKAINTLDSMLYRHVGTCPSNSSAIINCCRAAISSVATAGSCRRSTNNITECWMADGDNGSASASPSS
jgi:adenosylcobinamide-phosphate synthase